jgi:hypothetical protein
LLIREEIKNGNRNSDKEGENGNHRKYDKIEYTRKYRKA